MPELPDLIQYRDALNKRIAGAELTAADLQNPFTLRSVEPEPRQFIGRKLQQVHLLGKRLIFAFPENFYLCIHLMITGRLRWRKPAGGVRGSLLALAFQGGAEDGTLLLTEAGSKRRAAVHLLAGKAAPRELDPGGADPMRISLTELRAGLGAVNHTLKRALTDQKLLAGIGNAYSDEILHHARLSPLRLTQKMRADEWARLHQSITTVLSKWIQLLSAERKGRFPEKVTAFHPAMAVHGRYRRPCPDCTHPVQRIRYAENECNYCAACQNQARLLADRSLSRLLKQDWPKTLEQLEAMQAKK